jgi:peptidylprolyl isomerase
VRRLLALLALLPLLLLSACGDGSSGSGDGASASSAASLDDITVDGTFGEKPKVTFDTPFQASSALHTVLTKGDGEPVADGQQVKAQLLTVDGGTGKELQNSYDSGQPVGFPLSAEQINPGLYDAVKGVPVGSRVLAVVPGDGKDASSVVLVMDVLDAHTVPSRASGTPVTPPPGLPTVSLADDGAPTITLPDAPPPSELIVQPLITGAGPKVEQGQTITVHYTGVKWPGGDVFDSSWQKGQPAQFPIGVGKVIPGWDAGLVGQTVGSQVLLVIPPAQGYGEQGQPSAGIKGTDTLVFVVDILDAS